MHVPGMCGVYLRCVAHTRPILELGDKQTLHHFKFAINLPSPSITIQQSIIPTHGMSRESILHWRDEVSRSPLNCPFSTQSVSPMPAQSRTTVPRPLPLPASPSHPPPNNLQRKRKRPTSASTSTKSRQFLHRKLVTPPSSTSPDRMNDAAPSTPVKRSQADLDETPRPTINPPNIIPIASPVNSSEAASATTSSPRSRDDGGSKRARSGRQSPVKSIFMKERYGVIDFRYFGDHRPCPPELDEFVQSLEADSMGVGLVTRQDLVSTLRLHRQLL